MLLKNHSLPSKVKPAILAVDDSEFRFPRFLPAAKVSLDPPSAFPRRKDLSSSKSLCAWGWQQRLHV